jgi:xanthine dehydrogenase accessory factor
VGLACGGQIEVFVEPLNSAVYEVTRRLLRDDRAGAVGTVISGPDEWLGSKVVVDENGVVSHNLDVALEEVAIEAAQQALAAGKATRATLQTAGEPAALFVDVILPAPKLVMVGGVHIAIALTSLATTLGYSTIVVDPRRAFGSEARFPHVNRLIQAWPDDAFAGIDLTQSTAVAMLTHDPKIDDPALKIVLPSPVFYVGALGSSRTHAKRLQRLREAGVPQRLLARIHSPIGLDIDAQTPEEIAVAIIAEIVAARHNGSERD